MHIKGKGLCIVISEINVNNFKKENPKILNNPNKIAQEIRKERIISAIKELRFQTGWGLKESKQYIDKYLPLDEHGRRSYSVEKIEKAADNFLADHLQKYFEEDEFQI